MVGVGFLLRTLAGISIFVLFWIKSDSVILNGPIRLKLFANMFGRPREVLVGVGPLLRTLAGISIFGLFCIKRDSVILNGPIRLKLFVTMFG